MGTPTCPVEHAVTSPKRGTPDDATLDGSIRGAPVGPPTHHLAGASRVAAGRQSVAAQGDTAPDDPGAVGRYLWSPLYLPVRPEARRRAGGAGPHPGRAPPAPRDLSAHGRHCPGPGGRGGRWPVCGRRHGLASPAAGGHAGLEPAARPAVLSDPDRRDGPPQDPVGPRGPHGRGGRHARGCCCATPSRSLPA